MYFDSIADNHHLQVSMIFSNNTQFINVLLNHSIKSKRDYKQIKNDNYRVRAVYKDKNCKWLILCSIDGNTSNWVVKSFSR